MGSSRRMFSGVLMSEVEKAQEHPIVMECNNWRQFPLSAEVNPKEIADRMCAELTQRIAIMDGPLSHLQELYGEASWLTERLKDANQTDLATVISKDGFGELALAQGHTELWPTL